MLLSLEPKYLLGYMDRFKLLNSKPSKLCAMSGVPQRI